MHSGNWLVTGSASVLKQGTAGVLLLLFLLMLSFASDDHDVARRRMETGEIIPIERILDTLSIPRPVRILDVTLQDRAGRSVYMIEYLDPHGTVWKKYYDATSGKLLQSGKEK
jgi:uncharacterized membrane protein YkoI